MDWTGIHIETTRHARERFCERFWQSANPGRNLVILLLNSSPCWRRDVKLCGVAGSKTRFKHPDGVVLAVEWVTAARVRVVTVFREHRQQEAA